MRKVALLALHLGAMRRNQDKGRARRNLLLPVRKKALRIKMAKRTVPDMRLVGKAFRLFLVSVVALAVTGAGLPGFAHSCMEHHGDLTLNAARDECHDKAPEPCSAACPQIADVEHGGDADACACSVQPLGANRAGPQKSIKPGIPRGTPCPPGICSFSWFSPGSLNTLGAMPGVVPRTAAQLLALRTVKLHL